MAKSAIATATARRADHGRGREQRVGLAADGQEDDGGDGEDDVCEGIPDRRRSASPTATCSTVKPQRRSIAYESADADCVAARQHVEAAVEACESTSACSKERPGNAAIQGGAKVGG